jgi:hypothetical protein
MAPITLYQVLCGVQSAYYLPTAVWPLISIRSFEAVSGQKTDNWTGREADHWLVNTVAVLLLAVGLTLALAAYRGQPTPEVVALAMTAPVVLLGIDVVYVARRVISPIYLLDAVAEVILLTGWAGFLWLSPR